MTTAFLGGIIGAFAGFLDWDHMTAEEFLASWGFLAGITYWTDALAKLIKRRVIDPFINALKEAAKSTE